MITRRGKLYTHLFFAGRSFGWLQNIWVFDYAAWILIVYDVPCCSGLFSAVDIISSGALYKILFLFLKIIVILMCPVLNDNYLSCRGFDVATEFHNVFKLGEKIAMDSTVTAILKTIALCQNIGVRIRYWTFVIYLCVNVLQWN